jgi:hypothetical protein
LSRQNTKVIQNPSNSQVTGNYPHFGETHQGITPAMATLLILNEYVAIGNGTTTLKHVASLKKWKKCSGRQIVYEVRRPLIN